MGDGDAPPPTIEDEGGNTQPTAQAGGDEDPPLPPFSAFAAGGEPLCLVQLSSGMGVPLPQAGAVLGRSTASALGLHELGLKVHRKHVAVSVEGGQGGQAVVSVRRLGLNAACIIRRGEAAALGLTGTAEGSAPASDDAIAALVSSAEAGDAALPLTKKHALGLGLGDVVVLCHTLAGAFELRAVPREGAAVGGVKRSREEEEEGAGDSKSFKAQ